MPFWVAAQTAQSVDRPPGAASGLFTFTNGVKSAIERHLGRPYVWGASGMKSFDCSGFLWRVMYENGILVKRTTARKFFMLLPPASTDEQWNFGTVVFFDNLKHVGIIDNKDAFYHAQVTLGTNRSPMNSFWKRKIYGFRKLPALSEDK
jgi:cell wall-associated NlpC family hydrolase